MLILHAIKRSSSRESFLIIARKNLDPYVIQSTEISSLDNMNILKKKIVIKSSDFINLASSYDQLHSWGNRLKDQITIGKDDAMYGLMLEFDDNVFYYSELNLVSTELLYTLGSLLSIVLLLMSIGKLMDSAMYRKYIVRPGTTTINSRPRTNLGDSGSHDLSYFNNDEFDASMISQPNSLSFEQYDPQKLKTMKVDESNVADVLRAHSEFLELP